MLVRQMMRKRVMTMRNQQYGVTGITEYFCSGTVGMAGIDAMEGIPMGGNNGSAGLSELLWKTIRGITGIDTLVLFSVTHGVAGIMEAE
jgi:hypothetical protein